MTQNGRILSFLFLLFASSVAFAEKLPEWITNPPGDDAESIYGVGEGSTVERAQQDALKSIAGKLSTEVSSTSQSRAAKHDTEVSRYYSEDVQTYVKGIQLSDYSTVETTPKGMGFYTLVRMSRPSFVRNTHLRLDDMDKTIQTLAKEAEGSSQLKRFVGYRALLPKTGEAMGIALVLQVADPTFDGRTYLSSYRDLRARAVEVQGKTKLLIKCSPGLEPVAGEVARFLAEAEIGTTDEMPADGVVELKGKVGKKELFGAKNVQADVEIVTRELNGVVLKRHSYHVSGSAVSDYDTALRNAAAEFASNGGDLLSQIGLQ